VKGLCLISAPDRLPPDVQFWTGIIFVAGSLPFIAWIWFDATKFLKRLARRQRHNRYPELSETDWQRLQERAAAVIQQTISSLPAEVRSEGEELPWVCRNWAYEVYGRDALGMYRAFRPQVLTPEGGPIFLFIGDLWQQSGQNLMEFDVQVRTTYLHELGHHLGWDEVDLESRGLG
jgi:hypothetical protein